ncbi:hypothetical protein C8F01DRAFT_496302 [Mycena amicta]|nr:hypothetical protein C8F01DRAFT_496302 [Mycena amicta]
MLSPPPVRTPSIGPTGADDQDAPSTSRASIGDSLSPSTGQTATTSRRRNARRKTAARATPACDDVTPVKLEVEDKVLQIVFKTEGVDEIKHVVLTKTEDGLDIFKVDDLGLDPPIQVPQRYYRSFNRHDLKDVFGGSVQVTRHHWNRNSTHRPKDNFASNTAPFATYNRKWSHSLPAHPGAHGVGICNLLNCPTNPQPIPLFVGDGPNQWRLMGLYDYQQCGEIEPGHIGRLPLGVLEQWIQGFVQKDWGKVEIEQKNADLPADRLIVRNYAGVLAALQDGRLVLHFTILKCVGYPYDWFRHLEDHEAQMSSRKRKNGASDEADVKSEGDDGEIQPDRALRSSSRKRQKGPTGTA